MRGVLSLAAFLLFSNAPVFANPDVIELDCEVEEGNHRVITKDSVKTIDDSDRQFNISINKNDGTFYMLQSARNEKLVYANKFDEQGEFADTEGNLFGYSKESSHDTYNLNTKEWGRIYQRETINIGYDEGEYFFSWKIKSATEGRYEQTIAIYSGRCVRTN